MGLDEQEAAHLQHLHHLVGCQVRVLQVLEGGAGDEGVKGLLTKGGGERVDVRHDVHVSPGLDVRAEVLGGVRRPLPVQCGAAGDGAEVPSSSTRGAGRSARRAQNSLRGSRGPVSNPGQGFAGAARRSFTHLRTEKSRRLIWSRVLASGVCKGPISMPTSSIRSMNRTAPRACPFAFRCDWPPPLPLRVFPGRSASH